MVLVGQISAYGQLKIYNSQGFATTYFKRLFEQVMRKMVLDKPSNRIFDADALQHQLHSSAWYKLRLDSPRQPNLAQNRNQG